MLDGATRFARARRQEPASCCALDNTNVARAGVSDDVEREAQVSAVLRSTRTMDGGAWSAGRSAADVRAGAAGQRARVMRHFRLRLRLPARRGARPPAKSD